MKLNLLFLMVFVTTSYQQYVQRRAWVPQASVAYYKPSNPFWLQDYFPAGHAPGYYRTAEEPVLYLDQEQDDQIRWLGGTQSRGPIVQSSLPLEGDAADPRSFFGGLSFQNSNSNPLFRTKVVLVSQTLVITSQQNCVAASEFKVAGPPNCKRRRRGAYERLPLTEDDDRISPTDVEKVEVTSIRSMVEERNARVKQLLESSKDEIFVYDENSPSRDRRLFLNFGMTTTITTFSLATTTVQKSVKLLVSTTSDLNCIPAGFKICTAAA